MYKGTGDSKGFLRTVCTLIGMCVPRIGKLNSGLHSVLVIDVEETETSKGDLEPCKDNAGTDTDDLKLCRKQEQCGNRAGFKSFVFLNNNLAQNVYHKRLNQLSPIIILVVITRTSQKKLWTMYL